MFSFAETAKQQLLQTPSIPKRFLLFMFMLFPFLQPLITVLSAAAMKIHWVALALCGSDFVMEVVKRWSNGTLHSSARVPRSTREKLEFLWKYTVDAVRWLVVCGLVLSLGFSLFGAVLGLYALYLMLWGRNLSHVGMVVRWVMERLVPTTLPQASGTRNSASRDHSAADAPTQKNKERPRRTTSLKSNSEARCMVMDEGPHFHTAARGSLLGES
ncbi:membrane-associated protein, putative [Bodo saltans]|uniref:Membrane-associated protein, putative n=1 Tax=Bodo saltans TaxID=75058 RepID=A0A0S4IZK8_BODSA|nr:membrane-associated protein, putative [Bodo saltans]|eukprot:CUG31248.1 membrane-associated protein, putative [Bodo saltans]